MKSILFSACILFTYVSFAQAYKTTGGCGFRVTIQELAASATPVIFYNGTPTSVNVDVYVTGCDWGIGAIEISIDNVVIGTVDNIDLSNGLINVPLQSFHLAPQTYNMKLKYTDSECGPWYGGTWPVIVKDIPTAQSYSPVMGTTAQQQSSNVAAPQTVIPDEMTIYPMPVHDNTIHIGGIRPSESSYQLTVTNMRGEKMTIPAITRTNSELIIPARGLPDGIYTVVLKTNERDVQMRVQVIR
jgi:hypothetical protein